MSLSLRALCLFVVSAVVAGLTGPLAAGAQSAAPPSPAPSSSALLPPRIKAVLPDNAAEPESYTAFLRHAHIDEGLIGLIHKDDSIYFDLAPSDFDKTFIFAPSLASGLGAGTYAGRLYDPMLVQFKRVGQRVLWVTPNTDFSSGQSSKESLEISTAPSIVAASPIIAEDATTKHVAIAPTLLLTDHFDIGKDLAQAAGDDSPQGGGGGIILLLGGRRGGFGLDPMRSYYVSTKALPKNDEVTVNLTFSGEGALQTVPDTRGTPIKVHYSILEEPQPDSAFVPRPADDRIGYFLQTQKHFGDDTKRSAFRRYIDRWDLSKGPIVFTLTNEIPPEYRAAVRRGILAWNAAFAKIGYPNAIEVQNQPSDPSFDPDDISYNSVQWINQDRATFAAATPHIADPLTGRILHATITIDGEVLRSLRRGFVDDVSPETLSIAEQSPLANPALTESWFQSRLDPCLAGQCEYDDGLAGDAAFAELALNPAAIAENSTRTTKYIDQFITATTMHEVGHALGLRHNFIAPDAYSLQEVQNPAFVAKHGLSASVMAYNPIDIVPAGKPQPAFFQTVLGAYDYWAIQYGYTPNATPAQLQRIANRSNQRDLRYETDEDASGAWAIDPRVAMFQLSSDPIGWNAQRLKMADRLFATLDKRYPRNDTTYYDERMAFGTILGEYARSALLTTRWIGGAFESRTHRGQAGGKPPFAPIPLEDQKRAFALLDRYVFSEGAFDFSPSLIEHLGPDRFHGWGAQGLGSRPDFPLTAFVGNMQDAILYSIFTPDNIARISDESLMEPGKTMSLQDLFEWSSSAIFDDVASGRPIPELHRELQRRYADLLLQVTLLPSASLDQLEIPYETQELARYELRQLGAQVRKGLQSSHLDVATRAHLQELASRVNRGLDAVLPRGI